MSLWKGGLLARLFALEDRCGQEFNCSPLLHSHPSCTFLPFRWKRDGLALNAEGRCGWEIKNKEKNMQYPITDEEDRELARQGSQTLWALLTIAVILVSIVCFSCLTHSPGKHDGGQKSPWQQPMDPTLGTDTR